MKIAIIGGGAAGFFAAISAKTNFPDAAVTLFEKTSKLLSKVKVSGGGRCNVTNGSDSLKSFTQAYPRGGKFLKKAFQTFNNKDIMAWFEARGVQLKTEDDGRVFPVSNSSQSIIDCLLSEVTRLNIGIETNKNITALKSSAKNQTVHFSNNTSLDFDKVIIASGGSPKRSGLEWLEHLGHKIEDPVPSLFTFNMPRDPVTKLMGVVAENALVNIQGTKLKSNGPLLITHWGMSGPAILKLSAFGARILHEQQYDFKVQVNWVNEANDNIVHEELILISTENPNKQLSNVKPYQLPERLWLFLLHKCALPHQKKWSELGKKGLNKLVTTLTNDVYAVKGKTTFKEEFVTCGGINLDDIDSRTMQSKVCPNLYFAGEVMDIDGITGGFNFQSAWTTGYIAGKLQ